MAHQSKHTIGFVGAGRLAGSLAAGLAASEYRVRAISSLRPESARALAGSIGPEVTVFEDPREVAAACRVVFLTVPDEAIARACTGMPWERGHVAVHCSGALGLDVLAAAARSGAATASFHPLQTFPSRAPEPDRFAGISCGIEGEGVTGALLEEMAASLGAISFRLEGANRALYHASAVVASNLLTALAGAATRLWALAGLEPQSGREALSPLMLAAAQSVSRLELAQALTGPIARGDVATVERHLAALEADPNLSDIYRRLSAELLRLPLGLDPDVAARLRELLR